VFPLVVTLSLAMLLFFSPWVEIGKTEKERKVMGICWLFFLLSFFFGAEFMCSYSEVGQAMGVKNKAWLITERESEEE